MISQYMYKFLKALPIIFILYLSTKRILNTFKMTQTLQVTITKLQDKLNNPWINQLLVNFYNPWRSRLWEDYYTPYYSSDLQKERGVEASSAPPVARYTACVHNVFWVVWSAGIRQGNLLKTLCVIQVRLGVWSVDIKSIKHDILSYKSIQKNIF